MKKRNSNSFMFKILGDLLIGLTAGFLVLVVQDITNKVYLIGTLIIIAIMIYLYWEMWKRKLN